MRGINYGVYAANTIRSKLRPYPEIVERYTQSPEWIKKICGQVDSRLQRIIVPSKEPDLLTTNVLASQIKHLSSALSKEKAKKLEESKTLNLEGHLQSAYKCIKELREDNNWDTFDNPLKAQVLISLAGYEVSVNQDTQMGSQLVTEAIQIDHEVDTTVVNTLICHNEEGAESALKIVESPSNISSYNLKLGLLLELGRSEEVISQIKYTPQDIEPNADTKRIEALALLDLGDIDGSQTKIMQAKQEKPKWRRIRSANAIINYYSALSPAILSEPFRNFPEPVDWLWIKRDSQSLKRLREAESEFDWLARTTERGELQCKYWQNWRLACLANDPGLNRQDKAKEFCKKLLKEDPSNAGALMWAFSRNYPVDLESSQDALEQSVNNTSNCLESATILTWLYLDSGQEYKSIKLLEKTKNLFEKHNAKHIWNFWYVQTLIIRNNYQEASTIVETNNSVLSNNQDSLIATNILRVKAKKDNEWISFIEHLEDSFRKSGDGRYLYKCCFIQKEYLNNWSYVCERADELIENIQTPAALYLAVDCCWQAKKNQQCLGLIDEHKYLFAEEILPSYLLRWKVYCQEKLGLISEAIADANILFEKDNNSENLLTLIETYCKKGNLKKMVSTSYDLLDRIDISPFNLLKTARLILIEDKELAIKLWRKATKIGIKPWLIGKVIDLGFRLGLDREASQFLHQDYSQDNQEDSPLKLFSIQELLSHHQEHQKLIHSISNKYEKGEMPIHFVTQSGNIPLINIYYSLFQKNLEGQSLHLAPAIMGRHGSRPVADFDANFCSQWQIHIDVSSFLLAAQLDLLELVEQNFKPLKISPNFQIALQHQCALLIHHQPSQLDVARQITKLVRDKKLKQMSLEFDTTAEYSLLVSKLDEYEARIHEKSRIEAGYVVDTLPLSRINQEHQWKTFTLPDVYQKRIINCIAVIKSLKNDGYLTEKKYIQILKDLGDEGTKNIHTIVPPPKSKLYLTDIAVNYLAKAKILEEVCKAFQVFVCSELADREYLKLLFQENSEQSSNWLKKLITRVSEGIDTGVYQIFSPSNNFSTDEIDEKHFDNPNIDALVDLFKIDYSQPNNIIWADDRCLNKSVYLGKTLVLSILEIIKSLYVKEKLNTDEYYSKLNELREANIRYIPLTSEELIFYLKRSQINNWYLSENNSLSLIRKYYNSCLLDTHRLQNLPKKGAEFEINNPSEIEFVFQYSIEILNTLTFIWQDLDISDLEAQAYADWILKNLYVGIFGTKHLKANDDDNDLIVVGNDIGLFYARGLLLWDSSLDINQEIYTPRQKYFGWLESRIATLRIKANPNVKISAGEIISSSMDNLRLSSLRENQDSQLYNKITLRLFYSDLPTHFQETVAENLELMQWLGITRIESINLGSIAFSSSDFYKGITKAFNSSQSKIIALEPKSQEFTIQVVNDDKPSELEIELVNTGSKQPFKISDIFLFLLIDNSNLHESIIRSQYFDFDCSREKFEKIIKTIISTKNNIDRFKKAREWRDCSATLFYANLESKIIQIQPEDKFNIDELIPKSLDGLLRYFRFDVHKAQNTDFTTLLAETSQILVSEVGLKETLSRLVCLPVKLPEFVFQEIQKIGDRELKELLENAAIECSSPINKLHLIDLALERIHDRELIELAQKTIDSFCSNEDKSEYFNLFKAILYWVNNEFSYWQEFKKIPLSLKIGLIWSHASKIQNIFGQSNILLKEQSSKFQYLLASQQMNSEAINLDLKYWNDVLHPSNINQMNLSVHSLGCILSTKKEEVLEKLDLTKVRSFATRITEDETKLTMPSLQLWFNCFPESNILNSFLGGNRSKYLSYVIGEESSKYLNIEYIAKETQEVLDSLEKNFLIESQWEVLQVFYKKSPLDGDCAIQFKKIINNFDLSNYDNSHRSTLLEALVFISYQSQYIFDSQEQAFWQEKLINFADFCSTDISLLDNRFYVDLLECAFYFSIDRDDSTMNINNFAKLVKQIIVKLPNCLKNYDLSRVASELPIEQLNNFWEIVLLNRALHD